MHLGDSSVVLARAREGSRDALEELFAACGSRLLAWIRLRLGPRLRASLESRDILQATFLSALQNVAGFRGSDRRALMAWMAQIADNEIRLQAAFQGRQKRDVDRQVPLDEEVLQLAGAVRTATSRLVLDERLRGLAQALERLPDKAREIIVLRRLEELSYPEIGERVGKSPDACRMRFARAMATLTLEMRGDG